MTASKLGRNPFQKKSATEAVRSSSNGAATRLKEDELVADTLRESEAAAGAELGTMAREASKETLGDTLDQWLVSVTSEAVLLGLKTVLLAMDIFEKPRKRAA